MLNLAFRHLHHHGRFYIGAAVGGVTYLICRNLPPPLPLAAAGDAFFAAYVLMMFVMVATLTPTELRAHATIEDEGGPLVVLMALMALAYTCMEIFTVLNKRSSTDLSTILTLLGAPLGWLMFQMMAAFHYAYLFYRRGENGEPQDPAPLSFPKTEEPGMADFLYYSFVVAMTAQTSDVQVQNTELRKATTLHAIVSFFFNTVLIAMSVNAVVARAS